VSNVVTLNNLNLVPSYSIGRLRESCQDSLEMTLSSAAQAIQLEEDRRIMDTLLIATGQLDWTIVQSDNRTATSSNTESATYSGLPIYYGSNGIDLGEPSELTPHYDPVECEVLSLSDNEPDGETQYLTPDFTIVNNYHHIYKDSISGEPLSLQFYLICFDT